MIEEIESLQTYETACHKTFKKMIDMERAARRNEDYPTFVEIMAISRIKENWLDEYKKEDHNEILKRVELIKNWRVDSDK